MDRAQQFQAFVTGFGLSASLIVAIGAQNAFVLRQGLRREHVLPVAGVCALLDVLLMAAGVGGLASLLGEVPTMLALLALGGAALLAWYGLSALRRALHPQTLQAAGGAAAEPMRRVVLRALSISLLNPHVYLDTVVLVGAVGAQQAAGSRWAFVLGAGLASTAWFFALGYGARLLVPLFARPLAWRVLDVAIGITMLAIAIRLLLDYLRTA